MKFIHKLATAAAAVAFVASPVSAATASKPLATIFKNPQCTCCEAYGAYLRAHGYPVKLVATNDLELIKERQHIPASLAGCHTTLIGGYFVDGHVPSDAIDRLLKDRPPVDGISLPGMPMGSPGMGGEKMGSWTVTAVAPGGATSVFARY